MLEQHNGREGSKPLAARAPLEGTTKKSNTKRVGPRVQLYRKQTDHDVLRVDPVLASAGGNVAIVVQNISIQEAWTPTPNDSRALRAPGCEAMTNHV